MATNKNAQLALFTFTQPQLLPGLGLTAKKNEQGDVVSMILSLEKRKELKKVTGLDGDALNAKIIELSDALKVQAAGEFAKLAASNDWTGGSFKITKSKTGKQRATMSLISVNREAKTVSIEQVAKALAAMTDEQQNEILMKVAEMQKQLSATNIESEEMPEAQAEQPVA